MMADIYYEAIKAVSEPVKVKIATVSLTENAEQKTGEKLLTLKVGIKKK